MISTSSSAANSEDFPHFKFSLQMQWIKINQTPTPVPALSPAPAAAAQFWGKKQRINGNSADLQTSTQRGDCAYLSPNTVV